MIVQVLALKSADKQLQACGRLAVCPASLTAGPEARSGWQSTAW